MTKQEFLNGLRRALSGRMNSGQIEENIRYYSEFIEIEARKCEDEASVIAALGDPALIAKSILEAACETEQAGEIWEKRQGNVLRKMIERGLAFWKDLKQE